MRCLSIAHLFYFIKVTVDYTPNEADQGPIFENCPAPYLALLLYVGDKPPIPHIRHTPFPLSEVKYLPILNFS